MREAPKFTLQPTNRHVVERGNYFRIWEGVGEKGTKIELLVRVAGVLGPDHDGIDLWFCTDGLVATEVMDGGHIPRCEVIDPKSDTSH